MNSKNIIASFTLLGLFLLAGCGLFTEISISVDRGVDLSKYKTFAWLPDKRDTSNTPYNNNIIRDNLKNYFGQSFAERGFTAKQKAPDLLLQIVITNKKREQAVAYSSHPQEYYYNAYYYRSRYYSPYVYDYYYEESNSYCYANGDCLQIIEYVEGSITLNVIDRKSNKLVWAGTAKGDIYDVNYIHKDIHPAVKRIMKEFPLREIENKEKLAEKSIVLNTKK